MEEREDHEPRPVDERREDHDPEREDQDPWFSLLRSQCRPAGTGAPLPLAPTIEDDDAAENNDDAMDESEPDLRIICLAGVVSCSVTRSQASAWPWPMCARSSAKKYASAMLARPCSLCIITCLFPTLRLTVSY